MGRTQFDWRWLVMVVVVLLFFNQISLGMSSLFAVFVLGLCTWWMFLAGLRPWRSIQLRQSARATYWRGQRIELRPQPRRFSLPPALPLVSSIVYFALSGWLAVVTVLRIVSLVRV